MSASSARRRRRPRGDRRHDARRHTDRRRHLRARTRPDQNSTTLNGMAFAGADIPRDANTRVRVSASTYDPSRGWFSGANTNVELAPGNLFGERRSHVTLDAPTLPVHRPCLRAARPAIHERQRQPRRRRRADRGQMVLQHRPAGRAAKRRRDVAAHRRRRSSSSTPASAPDSAARFLSLLRSAGIPLDAADVPIVGRDRQRVVHRALRSHAVRSGTRSAPRRRRGDSRRTASCRATGALATTPTATPAHGGKDVAGDRRRSKRSTPRISAATISPTRASSSVAHAAIERRRTSRCPTRACACESDFADAAGGVASLQFGGNGAARGRLASSGRGRTATDVQFYASGTPRHRVKLSGDVRLDGYSQTVTPNSLGTFSYNSLADLAANTPASFTRTLNAPVRDGAEWNAFLAASDLWRISPSVANALRRATRGQRVHGRARAQSGDRAARSARERISRRARCTSVRASASTTIAAGQIRNTSIGNGLGNFSGTTPGVLRGGIGEFRGLTPATLLSTALVSTGLPGSQSRLSCIGGSVPRADWAAYVAQPSAIPSSCAGGVGIVRRRRAERARRSIRAWSMARSWRSNLAWSSVFERVQLHARGDLFAQSQSARARTI